MDRLKRYRFLLIVCVLAAFAALWEPGDDEDAASTETKKSAAATLAELYPEGEELPRAAAMDRVKQGDLVNAKKYFEQALSKGVKTNEDNFYLYAVTLVYLNAPQEEIDRAVENWRFHFPFSNRPDPREVKDRPASPTK